MPGLWTHTNLRLPGGTYRFDAWKQSGIQLQRHAVILQQAGWNQRGLSSGAPNGSASASDAGESAMAKTLQCSFLCPFFVPGCAISFPGSDTVA